MENRIYTLADIESSTRELMLIEKRPVTAISQLRWPSAGNRERVELESSVNRSIRFFLEVYESNRTSHLVLGAGADRKSTQYLRAGTSGIVRIDMADVPRILVHKNPDGTILTGSHIHLDIAGYGMRWALPLDAQTVVTPENGIHSVESMFVALLESCRIVGLPKVEFSLGV